MKPFLWLTMTNLTGIDNNVDFICVSPELHKNQPDGILWAESRNLGPMTCRRENGSKREMEVRNMFS